MLRERTAWANAAGMLIVLIVVGALYAPTLSFGFVWDDDQVIYGRIDYQSPSRWLEAVRQPLDFSPNYFRPLALSSLLVQLWLWGSNPAPFHAANVLIHLLNTALVGALGLRLLRGRWYGLLAEALYGVHPALVESVAFVSSRYDLLATLFLLLALWLEGRLQGAARVGASRRCSCSRCCAKRWRLRCLWCCCYGRGRRMPTRTGVWGLRRCCAVSVRCIWGWRRRWASIWRYATPRWATCSHSPWTVCRLTRGRPCNICCWSGAR